MFKLPFSILPLKVLRGISHIFLGIGQRLEKFFPFLKINLKRAEFDISVIEYLTICFISSSIFFIFISILLGIVLFFAGVSNLILLSLSVGFVFFLFVFIRQSLHPKMIANNRIKGIEKNLLAVLQSILVQLNSGIPLFDIIVNISIGDYGEISKEFSRAIREINAGRAQAEVLEELATKNPSLFFRRAIWQIVNGMKAGADISSVIKSSIKSLSEEQVVQIQSYGGQLNPLAMFYMLVAVILPALGITFVIILSSFIATSETLTKILFWGLYGVVVFFQIMFLGLIKSRRPNLLGD